MKCVDSTVYSVGVTFFSMTAAASKAEIAVQSVSTADVERPGTQRRWPVHSGAVVLSSSTSHHRPCSAGGAGGPISGAAGGGGSVEIAMGSMARSRALRACAPRLGRRCRGRRGPRVAGRPPVSRPAAARIRRRCGPALRDCTWFRDVARRHRPPSDSYRRLRQGGECQAPTAGVSPSYRTGVVGAEQPADAPGARPAAGRLVPLRLLGAGGATSQSTADQVSKAYATAGRGTPAHLAQKGRRSQSAARTFAAAPAAAAGRPPAAAGRAAPGGAPRLRHPRTAADLSCRGLGRRAAPLSVLQSPPFHLLQRPRRLPRGLHRVEGQDEGLPRPQTTRVRRRRRRRRRRFAFFWREKRRGLGGQPFGGYLGGRLWGDNGK